MSMWQDILHDVRTVADPMSAKFTAADQPVCCPHCHGTDFIGGSAMLNTVGVSFAHISWATEKKVTNLICDNCGLIQWFAAAPQRH